MGPENILHLKLSETTSLFRVAGVGEQHDELTWEISGISDSFHEKLHISSVLKLVKLFPMGYRLANMKPIYIHTRIKLLNEWMTVGGSSFLTVGSQRLHIRGEG